MREISSPLSGVRSPFGQRGPRVPALDPDLVLVFDTTLASGTDVIMPLRGTVDCTIEWGDGNSDDYTSSGNVTHTYAAEGTYTVRVSGLLTRFGVTTARDNLVRCLSFGEIGLTSLRSAFALCPNLIEVPPALPKQSTVTDVSEICRNASNFNDPNIIGWDVSAVTDAERMAQGATSFAQDISGWRLPVNGDYSSMLRNTSIDADLGAWPLRTAGVDMRNMLDQSAMSAENYSRTLIGWANYVAANGDLPADVVLGAAGLQYNDTQYTSGETYNDAVSARAYLTSAGPGWTITDGGQA